MRLGRLRRRLAVTERSHGPTIAAPFVLIRQSESQCQSSSAPGREAQELARIDPVFEHAGQDEPVPRGESEQGAFLPPAWVPSLLALARAGSVRARYVEFQIGSEPRASQYSRLNSSPNAKIGRA